MFETIVSTRAALEELAASFEPCSLTHDEAAHLVGELGVIRRLTEGMLAKAAKRVADSAPCRKGAGRDAAHAYARAAGVEASEARRAIGRRSGSSVCPRRPPRCGKGGCRRVKRR